MFIRLSKNTGVDRQRGMICVMAEDNTQVNRFKDLGCDVHNNLIAMPISRDACKLLKNEGFDITGLTPIENDTLPLVEGKYKPMQHQLTTAGFVSLHDRCYVLSDPRTGKTGSLILAMDYMQRNKQVSGGFLIITTLTTIHNVWANSIKATLPNADIAIVHGKDKVNILQDRHDFYITNYDSCRLITQDFVNAVKKGYIKGVVIDELTHVGNVTSQRHKAINRIVNTHPLDSIIGVTGSPAENIEYVFGMGKMINSGRMPCNTLTGWRGLTTYQWGTQPFQRSVLDTAPDTIFKSLQPAIRYNKADIIDLPPIVTQDRFADLTAEQSVVYKELKKDMMSLAQSGARITAANGGVLCNKLLQVSQGACKDEKGVAVALNYKTRLDTIIDIIDETTRKVVIFGTYVNNNRRLKQDIINRGYTCEVIDGDTNSKERSRILDAFQNEASPRVIICHPTTTAFGVELSAADTMVFNGPPLLGGFVYAQALERLSSLKQKANKISIIRVYSTPEEKKFFSQLDNGKNMSNIISGLFEEYKNKKQ